MFSLRSFALLLLALAPYLHASQLRQFHLLNKPPTFVRVSPRRSRGGSDSGSDFPAKMEPALGQQLELSQTIGNAVAKHLNSSPVSSVMALSPTSAPTETEFGLIFPYSRVLDCDGEGVLLEWSPTWVKIRDVNNLDTAKWVCPKPDNLGAGLLYALWVPTHCTAAHSTHCRSPHSQPFISLHPLSSPTADELIRAGDASLARAD